MFPLHYMNSNKFGILKNTTNTTRKPRTSNEMITNKCISQIILVINKINQPTKLSSRCRSGHMLSQVKVGEHPYNVDGENQCKLKMTNDNWNGVS